MVAIRELAMVPPELRVLTPERQQQGGGISGITPLVESFGEAATPEADEVSADHEITENTSGDMVAGDRYMLPNGQVNPVTGRYAQIAQFAESMHRTNVKYLRLSTSSYDDARDAMQVAYVKNLELAVKEKNRPLEHPVSFVQRSAQNANIDEARRRNRLRDILASKGLRDGLPKGTDLPQPGKELIDEENEAEQAQIAGDILERMSPRNRAVVELFYGNPDLSTDDVGNILGISGEAVKSRLFRARAEGRKIIASLFPGLEFADLI